MQIYLARNNQQAGPYSLEELNQMLAQQQVLLTDLAWHKGMSEWKPLAELTQGRNIYTPTILNTEPAPTSALNLDKVLVASASNAPILASLPQRALAKVIDFMLYVPMLLMPTAFMSVAEQKHVMNLQQQLINAMASDQFERAQQLNTALLQSIPSLVWLLMGLYFLVMLACQAYLVHKDAQTVGKKVMGLQIVDAKTQLPVKAGRGFGLRSLLFILLNFVTNFLISLIDYGFAVGAKRQTLHDKLARTQVIIKPLKSTRHLKK